MCNVLVENSSSSYRVEDEGALVVIRETVLKHLVGEKDQRFAIEAEHQGINVVDLVGSRAPP